MKPESLTGYLATVGGAFPGSMESIYARIGKPFSNKRLSAHERECLGILLSNIHAFRPGECYMNAGKIALERAALPFCEGFAGGLFPLPHAWVAYKGRAIDVTWPVSEKNRLKNYTPSDKAETIMQRVEHNLKTCVYFGVEIPTEILREHVLKTKRWCPLFDAQFHDQWELLASALAGGASA